MFATKSSGVPPSFEELRIGAARQRSRIVGALASSTAREFAQSMHVLAGAAARLVQNLASAWSCRCDIRRLQRLDDRMLADIGLGRSEIECACWRRPSAEAYDRPTSDGTSDAAYRQAA